jgi:hypothetical protein
MIGGHRFWQGLLFIATAGCCWLGMQAIHEFGHVLGAWCSGGTVQRVFLNPRAFSRTDLWVNPHPLVVSWCGPVLGAILPLCGWGASVLMTGRWAFWMRFFSGFCLIANGAYLGGGGLLSAGDAGDLLRQGAPLWQLELFALAAIVAGVSLWHGLGPKFGLGRDPLPADRALAITLAMLLVAAALLELALAK